MGNIYKNIVMEDVLDIIRKRGFYFICTKVLYPGFVGPKYIIVTDDPDVTVKHPKTKGMIIISPDKFSAMAEEYNRYFGNEDREKHRESKYHIDEGYSEEITEDENGEHQLNPLDIELSPTEDAITQILPSSLSTVHFDKSFQFLNYTSIYIKLFCNFNLIARNVALWILNK